MNMASSLERKFVGFDLSTQSLKAVVVDECLNVVLETTVQYDTELPEFRTHGGVNVNEDTGEVTSPTLMWVKAIDLILEKMKLLGLDFSTLAGLSGAGQQHGSVYWRKGGESMLQSIKPDKFLRDQLQSCFSTRDSPVWMDSSTTVQCRQLESKLGGPQKLADITGSVAFERFTGSQIKKKYDLRPEIYNNTERISLVSSFVASIFLGSYAPIDFSDGSGMNLMDIWHKEWSNECLEAVAPDLDTKLGKPVPTLMNLGKVSSYFVERYGFPSDCSIVSFTGDNPASLAGMRLKPGDIVVSLGTSDTVFIILDQPKPSLLGHVMCNPTDVKSYFVMLCYKNGSLTRERIRDECAECSWELFSELLDSTPRGNFGNIGMYFRDSQEICPFVNGDHRYNKFNEKMSRFSKEVEVRAVIEGQFLAKRLHAEKLGFTIGGEGSKLLATGGAARNKCILQVLSDVFNMPVYTLDVVNSAALGAAYIAKYGSTTASEEDFHDAIKSGLEPNLTCTPNSDGSKVYTPMLARYRTLEETIVNEQNSK